MTRHRLVGSNKVTRSREGTGRDLLILSLLRTAREAVATGSSCVSIFSTSRCPATASLTSTCEPADTLGMGSSLCSVPYSPRPSPRPSDNLTLSVKKRQSGFFSNCIFIVMWSSGISSGRAVACQCRVRRQWQGNGRAVTGQWRGNANDRAGAEPQRQNDIRIITQYSHIIAHFAFFCELYSNDLQNVRSLVTSARTRIKHRKLRIMLHLLVPPFSRQGPTNQVQDNKLITQTPNEVTIYKFIQVFSHMWRHLSSDPTFVLVLRTFSDVVASTYVHYACSMVVLMPVILLLTCIHAYVCFHNRLIN